MQARHGNKMLGWQSTQYSLIASVPLSPFAISSRVRGQTRNPPSRLVRGSRSPVAWVRGRRQIRWRGNLEHRALPIEYGARRCRRQRFLISHGPGNFWSSCGVTWIHEASAYHLLSGHRTAPGRDTCLLLLQVFFATLSTDLGFPFRLSHLESWASYRALWFQVGGPGCL